MPVSSSMNECLRLLRLSLRKIRLDIRYMRNLTGQTRKTKMNNNTLEVK